MNQVQWSLTAGMMHLREAENYLQRAMLQATPGLGDTLNQVAAAIDRVQRIVEQCSRPESS